MSSILDDDDRKTCIQCMSIKFCRQRWWLVDVYGKVMKDDNHMTHHHHQNGRVHLLPSGKNLSFWNVIIIKILCLGQNFESIYCWIINDCWIHDRKKIRIYLLFDSIWLIVVLCCVRLLTYTITRLSRLSHIEYYCLA